MLERLLILSAVLFCIGLYGALSRRHLIAVLIAIEIMFNAVNVALVAFSRFTVPAAMRVGLPDVETFAPLALSGQTFAAFAIVVAAAEVALGLALLIALVRRRDTTDVTEVSLLRR
jgi:NADH:ubiquinone oxidoreductase subunit K